MAMKGPKKPQYDELKPVAFFFVNFSRKNGTGTPTTQAGTFRLCKATGGLDHVTAQCEEKIITSNHMVIDN